MKKNDNITKCIVYFSYFTYINGLCNIMNYFNVLSYFKYIMYLSSYMILEKKNALLFCISHDIIMNKYIDMNIYFSSCCIILYLTYIISFIPKKRIDHLLMSNIKVGNVFMKDILHQIIPYPQRFFLFINAKKHSSIIETWVCNQILNKSNKITKHWWYQSLKLSQRESFNEIRKKIKREFKHHLDDLCVESIEEMDEIYVSANNRIENSSDTVFYNKHIDGPYYLYPFCSVYRCIYAINKNINIDTYIERTNEKFTLTTGDCLLFDFNREIHYISKNNTIHRVISFDSDTMTETTNSDTTSSDCDSDYEYGKDHHRITLKIHFITYPKYFKYFAMILKYLNIQYNKNARKLFLYTIAPKSLCEKIVAKQILFTTKATYLIEKNISFQTVFLIFCWILTI